MRRNQQCSVWLGVSILAVLIGCPALSGQSEPVRETTIPVPNDWSHHRVIFSRPATTEQAKRVQQDPRYWQQRYRNELREMLQVRTPGRASEDLSTGTNIARAGQNQKLKRDWQESMGSGASVGPENYPAKFSFLGNTANCGSAPQPDFVTYSTGLTGSIGQASVVAYDNLYSSCTGTVPSIYFAYNTSGQILTSPVYSRDGKQVAFVQTNGGGLGTLVALKWASSNTETVSSPGIPTPVVPALYAACLAPCMTTVILRDSLGTAVDDTTSSVYYDYTDDIAWVGGANGWLHKITGLFKGVPVEVNTSPWPVQVNPVNPNPLSNPVFDSTSGDVFVADAGGFLYRVDATTGAVTASSQLDFGTGVIQGPVVDSTAQLVYAFASSDGTANCAGGTACAAVYQFTTAFAANAGGTEATVGASVVFGSLPNPNPLYIGGFDNEYLSSVTASGNLYVCGNTGGAPTLYQVPIVAGVMAVSGTSIAQFTATSKNPPCSPVTDVYNKNASGGATEKVFVSVQNNGLNSGCGGGGCLFNFVDTPWQPSTAYSVGQEILALSTFNGQLFVNVAIVAGTSGATPPSWPDTQGNGVNDGTVRWLNQGNLSAAALLGWSANHLYTRPNPRILDNNGNVEIVNTAGTTGGSTPAWSTTPGSLTSDGTVKWINAGLLGSFVLPVAGGTSGVIIDNTVGSGTQPGASQVYFSTLSNQTCGTSGTGGCAVQASQSALQ